MFCNSTAQFIPRIGGVSKSVSVSKLTHIFDSTTSLKFASAIIAILDTITTAPIAFKDLLGVNYDFAGSISIAYRSR